MQTWFTVSHWRPAWKMSFHLAGLPYAFISLLPVGMAVIFALGSSDWRSPFQAVTVILPLVGAIQASFLFAPDDEYALEVLLASPRPAQWLILERVAAFLMMQGAVGLSASAVVATLPGGENLASQLVRWLPPFLALSGLSAAVSFMFRHSSYGVLVAILLYIATLLGGDALIVYALETQLGLTPPTVLSHAWVIHPFLPRGVLSDSHFLVNRLVLTVGGLGLFGLMARWIRNTERTLGKS